MNELKIVIDDKPTTYQIPSGFDEMDRQQYINACRTILDSENRDKYHLSIFGMNKKIWEELQPFQRYNIRSLLDFINEDSPHITRQLLPYIEIAGERFIGYQPNFSNTSWLEFIFADQYMMSGKYKEAAAVLYRSQRADYTGETDRRIEFTVYGTDTRMKHFTLIDEPQLLAFVINYRSLRKINLEEKYPYVFPAHKNKNADQKNEGGFSWVNTHRELMGDHFFDEIKFFDSNVHVILNRFNMVIRDNLRKKK